MAVRRSTIIDVAQLAGVSRQTVSRVLNASPNVSKKTEKNVLSAMKKLNYRPDSLARSMVTRRTYLLGALTRDLRYTHSQILEGAEIWARKAGFQIVISGCEHNEHGEPVHSPLLYGQRFDGLLIVYQGSRLDTYEILDEVLEDIPIVSIGYAADKPRVTSISIRNRNAARQATRHLISLGHKRIGHITGPSYYFDCEQHRLGYLDALKEAGLPADKSLIAEGSWTEDSGYSATNGLLENGRKFTAIFCQNDWMALGCLKALREHGIRVPEDIGIVGFDNIPPARFIDPPLTTVNYPGIQLGMLCVKVLTSRIQGDRSPLKKFLADREISIEPELIVRSSCGS